MNRTTATITLLALFSTLTALPPVAGAEPPRRGPRGGGPPGPVMERLAEKLELTDEQREKMKAVLEETRAELRESAGDAASKVREVRERVRGELTEEQRAKLDGVRKEAGERVRGLVQQHGPRLERRVGYLQGDMAYLRSVRTLDLTDEQHEKLKELRTETAARLESLRADHEKQVDSVRAETKAKIEALLTTEQKNQLEKAIEDAPEPRGPRPGPRGERGGPRGPWGGGGAFGPPGPPPADEPAE